jgi:hypothetical protein
MNPSGDNVKRLIWLYFWLLILEGALRKWMLPGLSSPLLLVRDPVAIAIYLLAAAHGRFPRSPFLPWIYGLACASFFASFAGEGNLKVSLFGLHANFLHLPLIFVVAEYFDLEEVKKMGKWLLVLLVPMAFIAVLQFRGGPDARINVGAGGEIGGQLFAATGRVRASGTFSFVTGLVSFLALSAAFLIYHFLEKKVYPRVLAWVALPALVLALGVCGSRSAVAAVSLVMAAACLVCLRSWEKFGTVLVRGLSIYLVFLALNHSDIFRAGVEVQRSRFESAGGVKDGIVERYFGEFASALHAAKGAPLLGTGLGMGTSAGAAILTQERKFLLGEGEWSRVLLELGPILGSFFLLLRMALIGTGFFLGLRALGQGQILPLLLLAMSGLEMLTGQFGQSTSLGFAVLGMGLTLASTRVLGLPDPLAEASALSGSQTALPLHRADSPRKPGRSRYAEALHGNRQAP